MRSFVVALCLLATNGCAALDDPQKALMEVAPKPSQTEAPSRSAALIAAYREHFVSICSQDATLAALHARPDVAEQVIAVYTASDGTGSTAATLHHVFADEGALVFVRSGASWQFGVGWRLWREGGLERLEPPGRSGKRGAW